MDGKSDRIWKLSCMAFDFLWSQWRIEHQWVLIPNELYGGGNFVNLISASLFCLRLRSYNALLLLSISHTTYQTRHRGGLSTPQNSEKVSRAFSKYQKLWNGRHGPAERYSVHEMSIRIVHSLYWLDIYSIFSSNLHSIGSCSWWLPGRITTSGRYHSSEKIKFIQ